MLKLLFSFLFAAVMQCSLAQTTAKKETPVKTIERVFKAYVKHNESTDSDENKNAMTKAINALQFSSAKTELDLLLNVWMYYDPTGYSVRTLLEPVFAKHKQETIYAIDKRLKNKKQWENNHTAPLSELIGLKAQLSK